MRPQQRPGGRDVLQLLLAKPMEVPVRSHTRSAGTLRWATLDETDTFDGGVVSPDEATTMPPAKSASPEGTFLRTRLLSIRTSVAPATAMPTPLTAGPSPGGQKLLLALATLALPT